MAKKRKRYSEEFRREDVNVLLSSGKSVTEIAAELGIELYNLARWKSQFIMSNGKSSEQVEAPAEKMRRLENDNKQLVRENAALRQERDILKKAVGIVSKP